MRSPLDTERAPILAALDRLRLQIEPLQYRISAARTPEAFLAAIRDSEACLQSLGVALGLGRRAISLTTTLRKGND